MAWDDAVRGSTRLTADNTLGVSGKPFMVTGVHWLSGGTAGTLVLRNGTTASGDIWYQKAGTIDDGVSDTVEIFFPSGCFYDHDSNTTFAVITGYALR